MNPPLLLLATRNRGKLREVSAVLRGLPIELWTLDRFPNVPDAVEDADTFEGNARKKALHYAHLTEQWTLADDSGLEVDVMGGAPGVLSARYAGEPSNDRVNNAKLIAALGGIPPERRTARFRCVIALAKPGEVLAVAHGSFEGRIIDDPRGSNGFGYDPHFWVPEQGVTSAEMPPELKNSISHRGKALAAIRPRIVELLRLNAE